MNQVVLTVVLILTISVCLLFAGNLPVGGESRRIDINFADFAGSYESLPIGFSVSKDGQGELTDTNDFNGIHTGGTREGACLGWDVGDGDIALGYQPTSDEFTPGWFCLTVTNAGKQVFSAVKISYDVLCLNNEDRSSSLDLDISSDGDTFQRIAALRFCSDAERGLSQAWMRYERSATMDLPAAMGPGDTLFIRWYGDDAGGAGARDEYGIDNVRILFLAARGTVFIVQ